MLSGLMDGPLALLGFLLGLVVLGENRVDQPVERIEATILLTQGDLRSGRAKVSVV